ncbi:putative mediator of RNA polymerase II transcription subunit 12 [Harmonia axyridis]|uniref:putative mediator of RNA polymerase II transcription subunit 12 n=1 Tax=Harmonia axyridis TaxID=115357 RepID=UPI001E278B46|nr:putative mediator of RNA polymerase II transcription subunit 12 [Harmonia axyridis]
MKLCCAIACFLFVISTINAQLPPRLNIPGAIPIPQAPSRQIPYRQGRLLQQEPQPQIYQRQRRPNQPVRPVIEEVEDQSNFDDQVNKLGLSALHTAVRQAEEEEQVTARPVQAVQFRPERPLPILRQDIRDNYPSERPSQRPVARQQEYREPQQVRVQQRPVQQNRPQQRIASRPAEDEEDPRARKPVSQILRKYRTDNADGSITWGFENDDGTFKEENIGVDCVIRGKYGYVDPDGVKREYSYESGNPCDKVEEEEELPPQIQGRKEQQYSNQGKKIQYRPISQ